MIVCSCRNVNDAALQDIIVKYKIKSLKDLQKHMEVCDTCRVCCATVKQLIKDVTR